MVADGGAERGRDSRVRFAMWCAVGAVVRVVRDAPARAVRGLEREHPHGTCAALRVVYGRGARIYPDALADCRVYLGFRTAVSRSGADVVVCALRGARCGAVPDILFWCDTFAGS